MNIDNLDDSLNKYKDIASVLKDVDIQLAYLVLLTLLGIKPLSRYEKPLDSEALSTLEESPLIIKQISRKVKIGTTTETVFSMSPAYINFYKDFFDNKLIDKTPQTLRIEGFLFGFPPCCIEQYIKSPYTKNSMAPDDQKILFHWACNNCQITATLLPTYRKIHNYLLNI